MGVKTVQNGKTSAIARCHRCGWECEDQKDALKEARRHTNIMRHPTSVEVAKCYHYEYEEK